MLHCRSVVIRILTPVFFSLADAAASASAAASAAPASAAASAASAASAAAAAAAASAADQTAFFDPDRCAAAVKACSVNGSALLVILRFNWQLGLSNI